MNFRSLVTMHLRNYWTRQKVPFHGSLIRFYLNFVPILWILMEGRDIWRVLEKHPRICGNIVLRTIPGDGLVCYTP